MLNLESCVIVRNYSRHWIDPLRTFTKPGDDDERLIIANPAEYLVHMVLKRYLLMWKIVHQRVAPAGTNPKFTCKGSLLTKAQNVGWLFPYRKSYSYSYYSIRSLIMDPELEC